MREQFKVDLRGIVDILSHHLYSSDRVYLRELLQNAHDAVEARQRLEPGHHGHVMVTPCRGLAPMVVRDNGIGLTDAEMRSVLATIGGSSKRDDFAVARRKFLGQFGIGLLSCFLIADEVEVRSRSAKSHDAETVKWVGRADGTFTIGEAEEPLDEIGTEIKLRPRHGEAEWCGERRVRQLVRSFAGILDLPVFIDGTKFSQNTPPWQLDTAGQLQWCRDEFGFEPMGIIPLEAPMLDVMGVCFVLPYTAQPGHRTGDRIYARGMLVADTDDHLLPEWAFFARAVIDAGGLPLTASREALQETPSLRIIREQLGRRILSELILVHGHQPEVYSDIVRLHATGLKALSIGGIDMRNLVTSTLPFETTRGPMSIEDIIATGEEATYVRDTDMFAAIGDVARHAKALVVNACGAHDVDLLQQIAKRDKTARFRELDFRLLIDMVRPESYDDTAAADALVTEAQEVLAGENVAIRVRSFTPDSRPVLWWPSSVTLDDEDGADHLWEGRPTVVLNANNRSVAALLRGAVPAAIRQDLITALYTVGLLQGSTRLSIHQIDMLNAALMAIVEITLSTPASPEGSGAAPSTGGVEDGLAPDAEHGPIEQSVAGPVEEPVGAA